jgi:PEP-CTERM motif
MNFAFHRRVSASGAKWRGAALAAAVLAVASAARATDYFESSYGGDFSNDSSHPTQLIPNPDPTSLTPLAFAAGDNIVYGATGNFDNDYFSFTIAPGEELKALTALPTVPPQTDSDRFFIGIAAGPTVPDISTFMDGSGNFVTASGLLGWTLFHEGDGNILPALGSASSADFPPFPGAAGFQGALGPGTYSMWVLDGDPPAGRAYSLDFTVGVPEPASWALMLTGFGLAGGALRRRVRQRVAAV